MFKYVKNLSGAQGVPETIEIPVLASDTIPMGAICSILENEMNFYNGGQVGGTYVTVESKEYGDNKTRLKVIKALPGMVFEVPVDGFTEESTLAVGMRIMSATGTGSYHVYAMPDRGDCIEVVGIDDFEETGKILVTFI